MRPNNRIRIHFLATHRYRMHTHTKRPIVAAIVVITMFATAAMALLGVLMWVNR